MTPRSSVRRNGAALIMALVAMAIITIVLSVITAQVVAQRQSVRHRQRQLQAEWLARAGAEWAAARLLQKGEAFSDDQQQLAPDSKVRISVAKTEQNRFDVTVDATVGLNEGRPVARTLSIRFLRTEKENVATLKSIAAPDRQDPLPKQ